MDLRTGVEDSKTVILSHTTHSSTLIYTLVRTVDGRDGVVVSEVEGVGLRVGSFSYNSKGNLPGEKKEKKNWSKKKRLRYSL